MGDGVNVDAMSAYFLSQNKSNKKKKLGDLVNYLKFTNEYLEFI